MGSSWKVGILSIAFLVIALFFLVNNNLLLSGILFALFVISLAGAFFSTLFKKDNARAQARVKERQARVRQKSKRTRGRRRRVS
jgi:ABC-type bacteriocin/lantibiotic exporter with double-glycine peptidase domain